MTLTLSAIDVPADLREFFEPAGCGDCYVCRMVAVFAEVRRVLRSDGTCWVNMGDGYASSPPGNTTMGVSAASTLHGVNGASGQYRETLAAGHQTKRNTVVGGLKPKDLIGMPWRLAFALQADGWWLRSEIIWAKPNPMPESVTDRPTKAHEQIFLLTKAARYFYDADAVREEGSGLSGGGFSRAYAEAQPTHGAMRLERPDVSGRNARSVWTMATQAYAEAHFATFPEELPRRCILAGTSERGVCGECGAPWRRVVEASPEYAALKTAVSGYRSNDLESLGRKVKNNSAVKGADYTTTGWEATCAHGKHAATDAQASGRRIIDNVKAARARGGDHDNPFPPKVTTGWDPACTHAAEPVPAVVLDPFAGSGTTLMVAVRHGRSALGIELNPEYARMARRRILADHGAVEPTNGHTPPEGRGRGTQGRLAF